LFLIFDRFEDMDESFPVPTVGSALMLTTPAALQQLDDFFRGHHQGTQEISPVGNLIVLAPEQATPQRIDCLSPRIGEPHQDIPHAQANLDCTSKTVHSQ